MSKRDEARRAKLHTELVEKLGAFLLANGATRQPENVMYAFVLPTKAGLLHVDAPSFASSPWIATRFEDVDLAKAFFDSGKGRGSDKFNSYSGKWNLHLTHGSAGGHPPVDDLLRTFTWMLEPLL